MLYVRRIVKPLAAAWIVCHLWVGVVASVVVYAQSSSASAEMACHCQHGGDHPCPMHKTTSGKARCAMRAIGDASGIAAVTTLLGPIGLMRPVVHVGEPDEVGSSLPIIRFKVFDRASPPTPPPPRP
jgi:hypothetical protein